MGPAHEYVNVEGNIGTCGITDYAQKAMGDIILVELPKVGTAVSKEEPYGTAESVKAVVDVYAPVSGTVVGMNQFVVDSPEYVNYMPETEAWFVKIEMSNPNDVAGLMDSAAYKAFCETEAAN